MTAGEAWAGRVLVVEDDESTALFVTLVLARNGFEAAWVPDAEQASHRLETESFDVLLADCRLPGGTGVELARATRLRQPGIGIAVMTSYAEDDTELNARSNGADDFFEKPLHSNILVSRIRELVTRSRSFGTRVPDSSPDRGASSEAAPVEPVPEVPSADGASGPEFVAEGGLEKQAATRDARPAQHDACRSGDVQQRWVEGAGSAGRARLSAPYDIKDSEISGCEEQQGGTLSGRSGLSDRDLSARALHPALARTETQRTLTQTVLMWASTAPATRVRSDIGPVGYTGTSPDWSVAW